MKPMSSQDIVSMRLQHQQIPHRHLRNRRKWWSGWGACRRRIYAMAKWAIGCRVAGGITEENRGKGA